MLVKNRSFFILIDLAAMAIAYDDAVCPVWHFALQNKMVRPYGSAGSLPGIGSVLWAREAAGRGKRCGNLSGRGAADGLYGLSVCPPLVSAGAERRRHKAVFRPSGAVFLWMSLPRKNLLQGSDLQLLWK